MTKLLSVLIAFIGLSASAFALPVETENYLITGFSRPCCSFGLDTIGVKLGFSGPIGKDEIGPHSFARKEKKDAVGVIYTCSAGFVDISHLRDNADWSAHIASNLSSWLGSGQEIRARREGGFKTRSVYFPKLSSEELAGLTDEDRDRIAVAITFDMALLHEITTAFPLAVSAPAAFLVYERISSFSVEDAFSNLQGAWLGVKAVRSPAPYDTALDAELAALLEEYGAKSRIRTREAFELVKYDWWTPAFYGRAKNVLRRDFTYAGEVKPHLVPNAPYCWSGNEPVRLEIPDRLSDGSSVHDYYEIRGVLNKKLTRLFKRKGIPVDTVLTQKDFPRIIAALKDRFVEELGPQILSDL